MSDVSTSAAAPAQPASSGEVVRGGGHAPGQNLGEAMPSVPPGVQAARPSEFKRIIAERAAAKQQGGGAKPPAPATARSKLAEFSAHIESRQQAPVQPNEPRHEPGKTENMGDPNQLQEPEDAPADPETPEGELPQFGGDEKLPEQQPDPISASDALAKLKEWQEGDMFPEELSGKLHEVKANGITSYVDTKELRQGYIRGVDYRRFHAEAKQVSQQAAQYQKSMQQHFDQIRDPAQMLEIYERNGFSDTLYGVAQLIATRDKQDRATINAAGLAVMQQKGIQDPNHREVVEAMKAMEQRVLTMRKTEIEGRRVQFERQQLEAERARRQSEQNVQQHHQAYENQLNQLRPLVFRAYGFADSKANRAALLKHLGAVISTEGMPDGGLTRDLMMKVGREMAEERETERGGGNGVPFGLSPEQWQRIQGQKARGGSQALPPQRTGAGGGQPMGNLGGQQRGRLSDLVNMVNKGRMRQP